MQDWLRPHPFPLLSASYKNTVTDEGAENNQNLFSRSSGVQTSQIGSRG